MREPPEGRDSKIPGVNRKNNRAINNDING